MSFGILHSELTWVVGINVPRLFFITLQDTKLYRFLLWPFSSQKIKEIGIAMAIIGILKNQIHLSENSRDNGSFLEDAWESTKLRQWKKSIG